MNLLKLSLFVLFVFSSVADAGPFRRGRWRNYESSSFTIQSSVVVDPVASNDVPREMIPAKEAKESSADDAIEEVNATRAAHGLRPFIRDRLLTLAARAAANHRARNLITGHTSNDFSFIPEGGSATAAGCAAWEPGMGWGACCTYEGYTYAGAAWAIGADGRRYMHIFVRN